MSRVLSSFNPEAAVSPSLLVSDVEGIYRAAKPNDVVQAALRVLAGQLRGTKALSSPQVVRDFLRLKLGQLEHEVFAWCIWTRSTRSLSTSRCSAAR